MNFLDAHQIIHDYCGSLAREEDVPGVLYKPKSFLKNSKDEIIDAYKLFYAHMIFFGTRTQEQYQQYEVARKFLNAFVDDNVYVEYKKKFKIITSKNPFTKLAYKNKMNDIGKDVSRLTSILSDDVIFSYRGEEIEEFFTVMQEKSHEFKARYRKEKEERQDSSIRPYMQMCNNYCLETYKQAHIEMNNDDTEYFYSFDLLRELIKNPKLDDIFDRYKKYISECQ